MKSRVIQFMAVLGLTAGALGLLGLTACSRDGQPVVEAEREGDSTRVHVDGDQVDKNVDEMKANAQEAGRNVEQGAEEAGAKIGAAAEQAGDALQRGADQVQREVGPMAEQAGEAIQRGADKVEREVGPVAREVLSDASITTRVKAKLLADPEVAALHIDVDTIDGRVTLNGKVASADQRQEAEKLASRTQGVKSVVNLIQVAGQEPPAPPATGQGSSQR
ncbi:MAG TPA: BON domain-containing protein [Thermoanaerobaculia bacterium]|nr:BON domain-containing protein [Thermoanaerobaculia bacterium]